MRRPIVLPLLALLLVPLGCGKGGKADIEGEVTLDGQPLVQGSILFVPVAEGQAVVGTIENGKYRLEGAQAPVSGSYRVEIRASKKSGKMVPRALGQPGEMVEELVEAVAERFNAKTGLTAEVKKGGSPINFAVFSQ